MKKHFLYLVINFFSLIIVTGSLNAQISEIWKKDGGEYQIFIGAANMDNDPQEEIVYCRNEIGILIFDGLTGKIDWDSGNTYKYIKLAGYINASGFSHGYSSPFLNLGNGLRALTFHAKDASNNPIIVVERNRFAVVCQI